jgi:RHS repeat-associated protein
VSTARQIKKLESNVQVQSPAQVAHQQLYLDIPIPVNGYLYTYVANESSVNPNTSVYFDDFKIVHTRNSAALQVLQTNDYYPFGLVFNSYNRENSVGQNNLYQGKELQDELGINLYDFEWRQYDPTIGRTTTMDPHADSYHEHSPFSWVANNPINVIDPDGRDFRVKTEKDDEKKTGTITISTTIHVTGSGASQKLVDKYNKYAEKNFKEGTYEQDGITYTVKFDVKYEYAEEAPEKMEAGDNLLTLNGVSGGVSQVSGIESTDKNGDKTSFTGNKGSIFKQDQSSASTIFHESMHFLGLTDRYDEKMSEITENGFTKKVRTSEPHKGFESDVMGTRGSGKISQIHYNNWGKAAVSNSSGVIRTRVDLDKKGKLIGGN